MRLEEQLIRHEGLVLHAYPDSEGYWTIGIGRLIDKRKGGGITKKEALYLLDNDIESCKKDLIDFLPWTCNLDPVRFDVLMNMCFNLGIGGLLKFTNTLELIKEGYYDKASAAMLKSKWAEQVKSRALELANQMLTGRYQDE